MSLLGWWRVFLDLGWLSLLCLFFIYFWRRRAESVNAQSWLKARGRITQCEWIQVGHNVWPKIEYSYQVYDQPLTGHYLFLDTSLNNPSSEYSRSIAYKVAVAFKENAEIDIYYNPNHPEQSALDVSVPKKVNVILGLVFLLIIIHLSTIFYRFIA